MNQWIRPILPIIFLIAAFPDGPLHSAVTEEKQGAISWIDNHAAELTEASDDIWEYAETSMREYQSARRLEKLLENNDFSVVRGVAGMPTAFVASYGSCNQVIVILAEYYALPGLSQQAIARKAPVVEGKGGHGCGHNLFGTASVGAALAVKDIMVKNGMKGTIKLFGCPAEETVDGKVFMAREGLFDGLSASLHWHPGDSTRAEYGSSLAMNSFKVTFFGKTAHGAGSPWEGRSALDAIELMNHAVNMMREHVKPTVRMHYVITDGGNAPNIVPDKATVWYFVRDLRRESVEELYAWMKDIMQGAALSTQTRFEIHEFTGVHEMIPNKAGAELLQANLAEVGAPPFTEAEQDFAGKIQEEIGKKTVGLHAGVAPVEEPDDDAAMGSTDVADVSWIVPVAGFSVACKPALTPGHHWSMAACGGMSIGHKGMIVAAKTLAISALDLLMDESLLKSVQEEWRSRMNGRKYICPRPAGQKPPVLPETLPSEN